jgi:DNA-binding response OmpR family regulator
MASDGPKLKKILIADDDKPMAKALELKLNHAGFAATSVGNGKEAIDLLAKEKFDLVSLDLVMPVMDGFAVLEEMKKKRITVPTIVFSSLSQEEDEKRVTALGVNKLFVKSKTPVADIVSYIEDMLHATA